MWIKSVLISCLIQTLCANEPFTTIPDLSSLPLLNPDMKDRKTLKIDLPNGLQALLISDPQADQSAASLAVACGSWDDPQSYPGTAHFCEHMLFRGTKKYPDGEDFSAHVGDSGGRMNAFTASDRTVYIFLRKKRRF